MEEKNKILSLGQSSFKFGLYLFYKLPAAFFSGIKIKSLTPEKCTTSVPYKWLTQNPFNSIYFASLAMAAEMSTGVLALSNIYGREPVVSMLVTKMEANYFKKAKEVTFFTCEDGLKMADTIDEAISSGEGRTITVTTNGRDRNEELIAEFFFTWSFKAKTN